MLFFIDLIAARSAVRRRHHLVDRGQYALEVVLFEEAFLFGVVEAKEPVQFVGYRASQ